MKTKYATNSRGPILSFNLAAWASLALALTLMPAWGANKIGRATCQRQSPAHTIALVELYSSEGCSSCPPADRWLMELSRQFTRDQLVPLSLHVDYWDYIGWKDPFAQAQFSSRQRLLTRLSGSSTAYTPEVFVGMKEFRNWHRASEFSQRVKAINSQPARATIVLKVAPVTADAIELEASLSVISDPNTGPAVHGMVVIYEQQLVSDVRAGENHGALLRHDNVVRYASPPFLVDSRSGPMMWQRKLPLLPGWNRSRLGIASIVQDLTSGAVLQAVSMPLCS